MSDTVKKTDVEDVLFSIRRLVSDKEADVSDAPVTETVGKSEALFLSSSLRVNDPATEPEQVDLEDMTTGMSHFRDAVEAADSETEYPSLKEVFDGNDPDNPKRRLHLSEVFDDLEGIDVSDEETDAPENPPDEGANTDAAPTTVEVTLQLAETTTPWADDPDATTLSAYATPEDQLGQAVTPKPEIDVAEEEPEQEAEALVDTVDVQSPAVDPMESLLAVPAKKDQSSVDLSDLDPSVLDEDTLRELVTDIVRDELSGVLGERITRNVRKLVRREIHRALMAREFD